LNEEAALPLLLTQLLDDNSNTLIIVADGGSKDRSRVIVADFAKRHHRICLVDNPKQLQSAGVNAAVMAFAKDHEWLVRIDAHCTYPDRYVQRLLDAAGRHGADTVVVPMVTRGTTCFQIAAAAAQNSVLRTGISEKGVSSITVITPCFDLSRSVGWGGTTKVSRTTKMPSSISGSWRMDARSGWSPMRR
jgi:glycosyltransferase involved in cell wall biosynthesis